MGGRAEVGVLPLRARQRWQVRPQIIDPKAMAGPSAFFRGGGSHRRRNFSSIVGGVGQDRLGHGAEVGGASAGLGGGNRVLKSRHPQARQQAHDGHRRQKFHQGKAIHGSRGLGTEPSGAGKGQLGTSFSHGLNSTNSEKRLQESNQRGSWCRLRIWIGPERARGEPGIIGEVWVFRAIGSRVADKDRFRNPCTRGDEALSIRATLRPAWFLMDEVGALGIHWL